VFQKEIGEKLITVVPTVVALDARVAAEFKNAFTEFADGDKFVLLDLRHLEFMDSSGLAAIVYCFQMTSIRNRLAICGAKDRVVQLFKLTRMEDVVRLFDTREDAIKALGLD